MGTGEPRPKIGAIATGRCSSSSISNDESTADGALDPTAAMVDSGKWRFVSRASSNSIALLAKDGIDTLAPNIPPCCCCGSDCGREAGSAKLSSVDCDDTDEEEARLNGVMDPLEEDFVNFDLDEYVLVRWSGAAPSWSAFGASDAEAVASFGCNTEPMLIVARPVEFFNGERVRRSAETVAQSGQARSSE